MGLLLLNKAVPDDYKDETSLVTPPDAAPTRLLTILQQGLPHPFLTPTDPPTRTLSTLPSPTGPSVVTTVADPAPANRHSNLTNRVTQSSRGSYNLCPVSSHSSTEGRDVQQSGLRRTASQSLPQLRKVLSCEPRFSHFSSYQGSLVYFVFRMSHESLSLQQDTIRQRK